jgi:hypothetical protein
MLQEHLTISGLLALCIEVYDSVFRDFPPFDKGEMGPFPFGRYTRPDRIESDLLRAELIFPDLSRRDFNLVESAGAAGGFPLVRVKCCEGAEDPAAIAHELGHVVHFAMQPLDIRKRLGEEYARWMDGQTVGEHRPEHDLDIPTNPSVAFIEAFANFVEFYFYTKISNPDTCGANLHRRFFGLNAIKVAGIRGPDLEGAVFGALFIDFASSPLIGLAFVVETFLRSKALTFDDYKEFIASSPSLDQKIKDLLSSIARERGI